MKKFMFEGRDTSGLRGYKAESETLIGLYNELVSNGTISTVDEDPYDEAVIKKFNKNWKDFNNDYEEFREWYEEGSYDLTDDEIVNLIYNEKGNAYYSTIYKWNGGEYEEI